MEYTDLTLRFIQQCCREQPQCYTTPNLNNTLYLNHKNIKTLTPILDQYTELIVLYLNNNAIEQLSHLTAQIKLHTLYLQYNAITDLGDALAHLTSLRALNLSHNRLTHLHDTTFQHNTHLENINLSHNNFSSIAALSGLNKVANTVTSLDLSHNHILLDTTTGVNEFLTFISAFTHLRVLYMHNNPLTSQIPNYRKTLISKLPSLTYLDASPVFENERRIVTAWSHSGAAGEAAERELIRLETYGPRRPVRASNGDAKVHVADMEERKEAETDEQPPAVGTAVPEPALNSAVIDRIVAQQNDEILIQQVINKYKQRAQQPADNTAAADSQIGAHVQVIESEPDASPASSNLDVMD